MLRDRQRSPVGPDDGVLLRFRDGVGRHVLELEGDDVDGLREGADGVHVVVRRVDLDVGDLPGRRVVIGRERVDAVAETARRHREHAAELPAAKHADGGAGGIIADCGLRIIADPNQSAIRNPQSAMSQLLTPDVGRERLSR